MSTSEGHFFTKTGIAYILSQLFEACFPFLAAACYLLQLFLCSLLLAGCFYPAAVTGLQQWRADDVAQHLFFIPGHSCTKPSYIAGGAQAALESMCLVS